MTCICRSSFLRGQISLCLLYFTSILAYTKKKRKKRKNRRTGTVNRVASQIGLDAAFFNKANTKKRISKNKKACRRPPNHTQVVTCRSDCKKTHSPNQKAVLKKKKELSISLTKSFPNSADQSRGKLSFYVISCYYIVM